MALKQEIYKINDIFPPLFFGGDDSFEFGRTLEPPKGQKTTQQVSSVV